MVLSRRVSDTSMNPFPCTVPSFVTSAQSPLKFVPTWFQLIFLSANPSWKFANSLLKLFRITALLHCCVKIMETPQTSQIWVSCVRCDGLQKMTSERICWCDDVKGWDSEQDQAIYEGDEHNREEFSLILQFNIAPGIMSQNIEELNQITWNAEKPSCSELVEMYTNTIGEEIVHWLKSLLLLLILLNDGKWCAVSFCLSH